MTGLRYGEGEREALDLFRPRRTPPGGAPVLVWIHGGSYTSGSGDLAIFDPARLVAENRVIVVSVTYRLGLFGFLATGNGRPANLGLLDQLEAFRWVRRNIAAFGGDPDRVTAFGQSAGGDAIAHLMAVPEAPALFRRAIIQSDPRLSKFNPLPRILFHDDFDEGTHGWAELIGNHDGNLDNVRPIMADLRPQ